MVYAAAVLDALEGADADERLGIQIVRKATAEPLRWIVENGGEPGYVVLAKVTELGNSEG